MVASLRSCGGTPIILERAFQSVKAAEVGPMLIHAIPIPRPARQFPNSVLYALPFYAADDKKLLTSIKLLGAFNKYIY